MKLSTPTFRGMAPRFSPRLLPENAAQEAINARLLTGDLEAWSSPAVAYQFANAQAPILSVFLLNDIWLSYAQEVEFARGTLLGDDTYRTYITGLDAPRWTNYDLATATGSPPYPAQTRLLGVPAPEGEPVAVATAPPPDESNITLTNPGAEAGNTSGWTITSGGLVAIENGDIPGFNAQTGTFFFGGGAAAATEAYQSIDLEALGVIVGQGLTLSWWQASGASGSLAAMGLRFYDSTSAEIAEVLAEQVAISPADTWQQRTLTAQVPDGAVTARLVQLYTRVGGGDIDAYIDTIAISSIAYTNSFDGSSLSGWQTSPNDGSGNSFRRVVVDETTGRPAPSFRFDADSRVPYFYRDFGADRSPQVVLEYDTLAISQRPGNDGFSVLFASAGGVGTGLAVGASGVAVYTFGSWDTVGANVQTLRAGAMPVSTWFTVRLSAVQTSATSAQLTVRVTNAATGEVIVDDEIVEIAVNGPMIGFKKSGNFEGRYNYVDNVNVTVAAPDPQDEEETLYTSYVYTFVNDFGEEGPPSDPSDTIQRNINATTVVTTPTTVPTGTSDDYGITFKRIYRAVTGALGSEFRFVAEIPLAQADYTDAFEDSELGEVLESEDWDLPPSDMRYILALPNGIMVGASGNQLCFSVQGRPHAWPIGYRLPTDSAITGLGNIDTSVVVGTETFVYTASGNSPDSYSMSKPGAPHACVSARSIAYLLTIGVVFAGPDGLMAASGPTNVVNLTEKIFTREQWQALDPSTITGIAHDDIYFFWWGDGASESYGGFALDMRPSGFGLIEFSFHASAAAIDFGADQLYFVIDQFYDPAQDAETEAAAFAPTTTANVGTFENAGSTVSMGTGAAVNGAFQIAKGRWTTSYAVSTVDIVQFPGGTVVRSWSTVVSTGAAGRGVSNEPCVFMRRNAGSTTVYRYFDQFGTQYSFTLPQTIGSDQARFYRDDDVMLIASALTGVLAVYRYAPTGGVAPLATSPALPTPVGFITCIGDRAYAIGYGVTTSLYVLDKLTLQLLETVTLPIANDTIDSTHLAEGPDGALYWFYSANANVYRYDLETQTWSSAGTVSAAAFGGSDATGAFVGYDWFVASTDGSSDQPAEVNCYRARGRQYDGCSETILENANGSTLFEFNAGECLLSYKWTGKLWLNPHPAAFPWVRVRAEDYTDLQITFYTENGTLLVKQVSNDRAFRLPVRAEYDEIYWAALGTSRVRSVELADAVEELV
jgi:hypothetical protein